MENNQVEVAKGNDVMSKPTVFFSHSSKDRDMMTSIKNKIDNSTGGVLDIFLSSDGQSIPFGTNWVHKIEDGLNKASIMFVFVTPNSIASNWIYFEAGFAYSKNIEVVPIGIGIDIALLKAPLNLLQGFNIESGDGLNNIITTINKKFDYHFGEKFIDNDYKTIIGYQNEPKRYFDMSEIVQAVKYELGAEYADGKGGKISYNIEGFFNSITDYLDKHNLKHSYQLSQNQKQILVYGIIIVYKMGKKQDAKGSVRQDELDRITFAISPFNFNKSFELFDQLSRLIVGVEWLFLRFSLNDGYAFITRQEHLASIMSMHPEEFSFSEDRVGAFQFVNKDLKYFIYNQNEFTRQNTEQFVLGLSLIPKNISAQDIQDLFYSLINKRVIYKV